MLSLLLNKWVIGAIALAVAVGGAYLVGVSEGKDAERQKALAEYAKSLEKYLTEQNRLDRVAQQFETRIAELSANERVIEREKLRIINRDVYRNVCLDADGLRLINADLPGATEASTSIAD